jgi:large subunit ribosomal protein L17
MEMVDYWLLEKDLIPKLFKVIVPRFQNKTGPYTEVFKLPVSYPGRGRQNIVMELKGNPYPPVVTESRNYNRSLTNILIKALKDDKSLFRK